MATIWSTHKNMTTFMANNMSTLPNNFFLGFGSTQPIIHWVLVPLPPENTRPGSTVVAAPRAPEKLRTPPAPAGPFSGCSWRRMWVPPGSSTTAGRRRSIGAAWRLARLPCRPCRRSRTWRRSTTSPQQPWEESKSRSLRRPWRSNQQTKRRSPHWRSSSSHLTDT